MIDPRYQIVVVHYPSGMVVMDHGRPESEKGVIRYADANGKWYQGIGAMSAAATKPFTSVEQAEIFIMRQKQ